MYCRGSFEAAAARFLSCLSLSSSYSWRLLCRFQLRRSLDALRQAVTVSSGLCKILGQKDGGSVGLRKLAAHHALLML